MKQFLGFPGLPIGVSTTALLLMAQPGWAAETTVTNIRLNPTPQGFELILNTQGDRKPPIFTVSRGNSSIADIANARLGLPDGAPFRQANPAPGISAIEINQLDANTVRITVVGINAAPIATVLRKDGPEGLLGLKFDRAPGATVSQAPGTQPGLPPSVSGQRPNPVPPLLPRAVAPPVGDIAIAPIDISPDTIDLGTNERIPRLLLREAPVREVLTLLARAANLNVAFTEGTAAPTTGTAATAGSTISLDIENESVQDVFNYVLRVTGMQANRNGQTIFIGRALPADAQNRIVRTFRLNQIKATAKIENNQTLISRAETGGSISSQTAGGTSVSSGIRAETAIARDNEISQEITEVGAKELLEAYGANQTGGRASASDAGRSTILNGLEVVADARANTITVVGTPRKVEIAAALLAQFDIRRRQAVVNVKIIDVDLLKNEQSNSDIQWRVNNTLGYGFRPSDDDATVSGFIGVIGNAFSQNTSVANTVTSISKAFLFTIFAAIQDNSAKILTNPTLIVQEGSSAQVNLTQEVFSGYSTDTQSEGSASGAVVVSTSFTPIIRPAGVILNITIDQIDDNGFVTLNVSPEVSVPNGDYLVEFPGIPGNQRGTLLAQRRLETGKIRLRDGQTLLLTGIIQDQDRVSVSKVPIIGDIPLLGRLFRRESSQKRRNELVVLVTPQIMRDSQQSSFGYQYTPGPEVDKLLDRRNP